MVHNLFCILYVKLFLLLFYFFLSDMYAKYNFFRIHQVDIAHLLLREISFFLSFLLLVASCLKTFCCMPYYTQHIIADVVRATFFLGYKQWVQDCESLSNKFWCIQTCLKKFKKQWKNICITIFISVWSKYFRKFF